MTTNIKQAKWHKRTAKNDLFTTISKKIKVKEGSVLRFNLIFWYIAFCTKYRAAPWKYFQLNAKYFNPQKGLFSKIDVDQLIPKKWKLKQAIDDGTFSPDSYPVFYKPEWGQNAYGIKRFNNVEEFESRNRKHKFSNVNYLVQEAAPGKKEFEIFYIRNAKSEDDYSVLTITSVSNKNEVSDPINSIRNPNTKYQNISHQLSEKNKTNIWHKLRNIGQFKIARVGLRANSVADILNGDFHIFEINLFTPMPINLLDDRDSLKSKIFFVKKTMRALAKITKTIPKSQKTKSIFFHKLIKHYQLKI